MFDETKKYKTKGHFFFKAGEKLAEVSKEVPDKPGVYYILRLARGKIQIVYIGKSGFIAGKGKNTEKLLKESINGTIAGIESEKFFENKIRKEDIDGLDIYWYVTMDKANNDLPEYVAGLLKQRFFEIEEELPEWNLEERKDEKDIKTKVIPISQFKK